MPAYLSLSGSSTHTLVLQTRFIESTLVYPLCCVFTLPFLGTVVKTVIGSDRSVPRSNGYTKEPRCAVCCVVWVCVDTRCVMFPQHTTTERILNVSLHDDMQISRYVLFKSLLISKYIHILA